MLASGLHMNDTCVCTVAHIPHTCIISVIGKLIVNNIRNNGDLLSPFYVTGSVSTLSLGDPICSRLVR